MTESEAVGWYHGTGPNNEIILSGRVRISRNISGFPFPHKLNVKQEQEVQELVEEAIRSVGEGTLRLERLQDLPLRRRKLLIEKHFISQQFSLEKGKSLIIDEDETIGGMVNEKDHLRIAAFSPGLDLNGAYDRILPIEKQLEERLDFAVSLDRGFLTPSIKQTGTGLRASLLLHLPALEHSSLLERAFKSAMQEGLSVKGYMGDDNHSLGYFYQLYNPISIGESEKDLLEKLARVALQLVDYEKKVREEMLRRRRMELEDIVWRAYGVLRNCRMIDEREAIGLLSDLRLGVVLGWIDIPLPSLDTLFVESRTAHVQQLLNDEELGDTAQAVRHERARMIQERLALYRR